MPRKWRDINEASFAFSRQEGKAPVVELPEEEAAPVIKEETVVRLSDPVFIAGSDGFEFNKSCKVRVKVDYLKNTPRKRVLFNLFSQYKDTTQNMRVQVEGFEKDGFAESEVTLFYNDDYYTDIKFNGKENDPDSVVEYYFKASHTQAENEVESEPLNLPFMPPCMQEKQKNKAAANKNASKNSTSTCNNECEQCDKKEECLGDPCQYEDQCAISEKCKREKARQETMCPEPAQQLARAQMNKKAAQDGSACTQDCSTCEKREECENGNG